MKNVSMRPRSGLITLALFSSLAVACTASSKEEVDVAEGEDDLTAARTDCSREAYDFAEPYYQEAVAIATARLESKACERGMIVDIGQHAAAAVHACKAFEKVIETSDHAAPLRKALEGNLALPILTGKLVMTDAEGRGVWIGVQEALPGNTIYGPVGGAGHISKLTFGSNGSAALFTREGAVDEPATWKEMPAHYEIGPVLPGGSLQLKLTRDGAEALFEIYPAYRVNPGVEIIAKNNLSDTFQSLPVECR